MWKENSSLQGVLQFPPTAQSSLSVRKALLRPFKAFWMRYGRVHFATRFSPSSARCVLTDDLDNEFLDT